jgi:uncharacterized protein YkwD
VSSTLAGFALAAIIGSPQVLPLSSGSAAATQQGSLLTSARATVPNRTADMNAMLAALNTRRGSQGLPPLQLDPSLCAIAYDHAADMVARSYFDHYTPEGLSPFARMDRAHYHYGYAGENIALDQSTAAAERALWESREHRDNILGAHYAKVGIAAVAGSEGEIIVEDFSD